jgi:hypothetical protein
LVKLAASNGWQADWTLGVLTKTLLIFLTPSLDSFIAKVLSARDACCQWITMQWTCSLLTALSQRRTSPLCSMDGNVLTSACETSVKISQPAETSAWQPAH